jgi:hypothetical protein
VEYLIENGVGTEGPLPSLVVSQGDAVSVSINQAGGAYLDITMTDDTNGQSWSSDVSYEGPPSSAE